jgi:hypothetical protein
MAGRADELPVILRRIPNGRLVVLGKGGYGKTTLMIRLVLKLLEQRKSGDPVPVLVPMTTWNPEIESLRGWLEEQLSIAYPALGAMAPGGSTGKSVIGALLDDATIMPVLDGFDEMPAGSRITAIRNLNALPDSFRWVLTCRTEDYRKTVGGPGAPRHLLHGAVVELSRLDSSSVAHYLTKRGEAQRWRPVLTALEAGSGPIAQALRSPLYASLAFEIYSPPRYQRDAGVPDPRELCDPEKFPTAEAVEKHLLKEYTAAAYRRTGHDKSTEIDIKRIERWLSFLAAYLERRSTSSLQWWDLEGIAPRWLVPTVVGAICGAGATAVWGAAESFGIATGSSFGIGLLIALAIALILRRVTRMRWQESGEESDADRLPLPGMIGGMVGAVAGAFAAGIANKNGIGHAVTLVSGIPGGIGIGIGAGASARFIGGLAGGLVGSFVAASSVSDYLGVVGSGVPAALINGLSVGLAVAFIVAYRARREPARQRGTWKLRYGVPAGAVIGLAMGLITAAQKGSATGAAAGLLTGAAAAYPIGLRHSEEDLDYIPSPGEALRRDASAFRRTSLSASLAAGTIGFIGVSLTEPGLPGGQAGGFAMAITALGAGMAAALIIGILFGLYQAASPKFYIINWYLALRGQAPWRLQRFLDDASSRGVLRQVGPAYQFRHELLKEHLATQAVSGRTVSSPFLTPGQAATRPTSPQPTRPPPLGTP